MTPDEQQSVPPALAAFRLAAIVESSDDAIISKDFASTILTWNGGAQKIFGYTAAEMIGASVTRLIPVDRQDEESRIMAKIRRGEIVAHFDTVRQAKDGRLIDVSVSVSPVKDAAGKVIGASKIARDISRQKAHEREIDRLTRLYSALSQVNQAIVKSSERQLLFDRVCQALVQYGGFRMAWIGLLDPVSRKISVASRVGDERNYLANVEIYADDRPEGQGPTATAIREGRTYICNDFAQDPRARGWRDRMEVAGYRAVAILPIRAKGVVSGSISVYAAETGFFQDREIGLLEEAAGDVSFGVDHLAQDEVRRAAEQGLRVSEEKYRTLFETLIEGFCTVELIFDAAGKALDYRFLEVNPAFGRLSGLQDVPGRTIRELAPGFEEHWFDKFGRVARTGQPVHFEEEATVLDRHYDVYAYRVGGEGSLKVAILFNDVTERKRAEAAVRKQLDELLRWQEVMLNREERVEVLKAEVNEELARQGQPARYGTGPKP